MAMKTFKYDEEKYQHFFSWNECYFIKVKISDDWNI